MARLEVTLGLLPSIIDRLIDPESAGTAIMIGYDVPQMYRAVLRDLEELLNTRQTYRDLPEAYTEVHDSIICYGLPDLMSIDSVSSNTRSAIGRAIQHVIERFEPRLRDVRVNVLDPGENWVRHSVRFRVDARLAVDPAPDVAFDTILEMASGRYQVTKAANE
ncbi:MAG: type VI secretion system baseplate subunit TssE [Planctomycetes bacterium]|nr:type VI secretion system baseplate subunit TssE [Planctomycetota bacterium]